MEQQIQRYGFLRHPDYDARLQGSDAMQAIDDRSIILAKHIIDTKDTVRKTARLFGISKSTVHKDVTERLRRLNHALFLSVHEVLEQNKSERHIRGGIATREKYKHQYDIATK